jgi:hypothetical protein
MKTPVMEPNPYESSKQSDTRLAIAPAALQSARDRWLEWSSVTFGAQGSGFLLFGMTICGCHFHWVAALGELIPVAWAVFTLAYHRAVGERVVAYVNMVLALGWLWIGWQLNMRFLFGWSQ